MATHVELEPLVSTDWLEAHLNEPNVRVLDIRGSVSTARHRAGRRRGDVSRRAGGIPRGAYSGGAVR